MQACGTDEDPADLVTLQRAGFIGERDGAVYPLLPNAWQLCNVGRFPLSTSLRNAVLDRDSRRCVSCDSEDRLQIDHVFPVALGGGDEAENLRTLCQPCNGSKGARV
ncbi:HNH endonuclease [Streptomyces sp. MZ04]|nr:HNH endonuclease [Streptomyces sp. MZ04]